jgi:hypothetical protein
MGDEPVADPRIEVSRDQNKLRSKVLNAKMHATLFDKIR